MRIHKDSSLWMEWYVKTNKAIFQLLGIITNHGAVHPSEMLRIDDMYKQID